MKESLDFEMNTAAHGPLKRGLIGLTQAFALGGGLILVGLIGMSMVSIIGRKLFSTPVRGDMELMEVGAAIAIAAFLPLCELRGTHIKVDALTSWLPEGIRRGLDTLAHLACAAVAGVLAWRTALQALDNHEYGDATTLLSFPLWIPLALIVPSLVLLGICALARACEVACGGKA
ncbi:TRAP transporter small permease [Pseudomonas sp. LRF_L74]|uniref:TRAP transporter small permease n=1 Tax=Pseudomonas sp. LRF_L74 TaxID=3369422 RepID=UPI003F6055A6